jgi:hypothetical protein
MSRNEALKTVKEAARKIHSEIIENKFKHGFKTTSNCVCYCGARTTTVTPLCEAVNELELHLGT